MEKAEYLNLLKGLLRSFKMIEFQEMNRFNLMAK